MDRASYDAALAFLLGRIDYERAASPTYGEREFKLDRMHDLLARLGHPQRQLPKGRNCIVNSYLLPLGRKSCGAASIGGLVKISNQSPYDCLLIFVLEEIE